MREQGGLAGHAFGEVADQVRHRGLQLAGVGAQPAGAHIVHPGAAAFAGAGRLVQVKLADQLAGALDAVELHLGLPHRRCVFGQVHVKQGFDNLEKPFQHFGGGEVLFDFLLAECVTRFFKFFTDVGVVPGLRVAQLQVLGGKGAQVGHVFFGIRTGATGQVAQEADHLFGRVGHLGHHRDFAEILVAQQARFFESQGQDLRHDGAVVKLAVLMI